MKSLREFYHHPEVLRGETESFSAESVLCACVLSRFSRIRLCATPQTAAHQAPPSLVPTFGADSAPPSPSF